MSFMILKAQLKTWSCIVLWQTWGIAAKIVMSVVDVSIVNSSIVKCTLASSWAFSAHALMLQTFFPDIAVGKLMKYLNLQKRGDV